METKPNNGDGEEELDRFSTLPEEISHRILSRVVLIRDLARLCCVSSTCRKLALSSPDVSIGSDDLRSNQYECESRLRVMNSFDRFFLSRRACKMRRFYLIWQVHDDEDVDEPPCFCVNVSFRVFTWILNALRCDVEMLHIDMGYFNPYFEPVAFPLSVFKCASLRSLTLRMSNGLLKTPSLSFSSNLETLELGYIDIEDEEFYKWVSCSCKLLKKMSLTRVRGTNVITIESLSLEDFYYYNYEMSETYYLNISGENIENIYIYCCDENTILNLIAPKIKILTLEGSVINNRNLGDLGYLGKAFITMDPIEDEFDKAAELLSSLCNAEVLTLNEAVIKAAYKEVRMNTQLDKLQCMRIDIGSFDDDLVPSFLSLLRGAPNFLALYICYEPAFLDPESNTSGFDKMYWEKQDLDFISGVKEVSFDLSGGSNGVEFARYVLENGTNLEKMVIRYLTLDSSVEKTFEKSCMMTNASVYFEEYSRPKIRLTYENVLSFLKCKCNVEIGFANILNR